MYNIVVLTMNSFLHLVDQDTLLIVSSLSCTHGMYAL